MSEYLPDQYNWNPIFSMGFIILCERNEWHFLLNSSIIWSFFKKGVNVLKTDLIDYIPEYRLHIGNSVAISVALPI